MVKLQQATKYRVDAHSLLAPPPQWNGEENWKPAKSVGSNKNSLRTEIRQNIKNIVRKMKMIKRERHKPPKMTRDAQNHCSPPLTDAQPDANRDCLLPPSQVPPVYTLNMNGKSLQAFLVSWPGHVPSWLFVHLPSGRA